MSKKQSIYDSVLAICLFVISCSGGSDEGDKFVPEFILIKDNINFHENGGEKTILYRSNVDLNVVADNWISIKNKTVDNGTISQEIEIKPMIERQQMRKGFIKFTNEKYQIKDSIEVIQTRPLLILVDYNFEAYLSEEFVLPIINETGNNLVWNSSDDTIVNVSEGKISVTKEGSATISVSTTDGSHVDKIMVNACDITTKLTCTFESYSVGFGGYRTIYTTCFFHNGCQREIKIKALKVHWGMTENSEGYVTEADPTYLGILRPNETTSLCFTTNQIGGNDYDKDLIFEWIIELNENEFACNYPIHVYETW